MTRRLRSKEMVRYLRASSRARPVPTRSIFPSQDVSAVCASRLLRRRHAHPATVAVPFVVCHRASRSRPTLILALRIAPCFKLALTGIAFTLAIAALTGLSIAPNVAAAISATVAVAAAAPALALGVIAAGGLRVSACGRHYDRRWLGNVAAGKERDDAIPQLTCERSAVPPIVQPAPAGQVPAQASRARCP